MLADPGATDELGRRIGELAEADDIIVLTGPLGAGKTTFAQGFARGLQVPGPVRSPTYTLLDVHLGGRLPLLHADAWRLGESPTLRGLDGLGLDEAPEGAVLLVEWGEGIVEPGLIVRLDRPVELEGRVATLEAMNPSWTTRLAAAGLL